DSPPPCPHVPRPVEQLLGEDRDSSAKSARTFAMVGSARCDAGIGGVVSSVRAVSSRAIDVCTVGDGEHRDSAGIVLDGVDDPVGPAASGPAARQLEAQWLAEA